MSPSSPQFLSSSPNVGALEEATAPRFSRLFQALSFHGNTERLYIELPCLAQKTWYIKRLRKILAL